ncbi:hypothetical protein EV682_10992 [Iodobacter fluviatilis]|uniref:Uncharacterized protein n=1 Tax=Iodobacter fluviatilis TaxID=537 RepID=A0A377Q525_9NEIS|nr:hypothetical protein EV682_10992 [Iodobacter fluviatilis]STQ90033.1 Uncharacterised protein [Iodobacter fluviatilis]
MRHVIGEVVMPVSFSTGPFKFITIFRGKFAWVTMYCSKCMDLLGSR